MFYLKYYFFSSVITIFLTTSKKRRMLSIPWVRRFPFIFLGINFESMNRFWCSSLRFEEMVSLKFLGGLVIASGWSRFCLGVVTLYSRGCLFAQVILCVFYLWFLHYFSRQKTWNKQLIFISAYICVFFLVSGRFN